jgi:hypothetical protein
MPALGADFGIILAYLVPGFLALWAMTHGIPQLHTLFRTAGAGDKRALALFSVSVLALALGMFLSILRAGTIDKSFDSPVLGCDSESRPHCAPVKRVDPDFLKLACKGLRESFLLAEARDKRPYQFYGNMALALVVVAFFVPHRIVTEFPKRRGRVLLIALVAWLAMMLAFYSAARLSHFRFMESVTAINATKCELEK